MTISQISFRQINNLISNKNQENKKDIFTLNTPLEPICAPIYNICNRRYFSCNRWRKKVC